MFSAAPGIGGRLHPDDLVQLARLVVAELSKPVSQAPNPAVRADRLLTAREVGDRYGLTATWVREHADELGVLRPGSGPKPRLKFDAATIAQRLSSCSSSRRAVIEETAAKQQQPSQPRGRSSGRSAPLLPVSPRSRRSGAG